VVSDCGAVEAVASPHRYRSSNVEAAAATLKAGTDLSCENYSYLHEALRRGLVTPGHVEGAARRALSTRARLGMLLPRAQQPYANIPMSAVGSSHHLAKAIEAVERGAVLLKNIGAGEGGAPLLPLNRHLGQRIVVAGPMAHTTEYMLGNYYGTPSGGVMTPFAAIKALVDGRDGSLVTHHPGGRVAGWNAGGVDETISYCSKADVCILCMGTSSIDAHSANDPQGRFSMWSPQIEGEMLDRSSLLLPGVQEDVIKGVARYTNTSIVLLLIHGGPLDVSWAQHSARVGAIVTAHYPGQGAGGIANLLFGEASFAGRLPVTWPFNNYTDQIRMGDMNMADWPGRGYRHIAVPVLYPFGHGLSYSTFQYSHLRAVPAATDASESQTSPVTGDRKVHVHVEVHNAGTRASDEVVLLYVVPHRCGKHPGRPAHTLPRKVLKHFKRVHMKANGRQVMRFTITSADLQLHGIQDASAQCEWSVQVSNLSCALPFGRVVGGSTAFCLSLQLTVSWISRSLWLGVMLPAH